MPEFKTFDEFYSAAQEYIAKDLHRRGEIVVPKSCSFMGALFFMKVKSPDQKRAKRVVYSAAVNILPGYRELFKDEQPCTRTVTPPGK